MNRSPPTSTKIPKAAPDRAALTAWHAGWAVAVALLAMGAGGGSVLNGPAMYALLALIAPGLLGPWLLAKDTAATRGGLLGAWVLAAVTASALAGGLTGPLAGFVFMPLAAGLALGSRRAAQMGAAGAGLAALAGMASTGLVGPGTGAPLLAAASAVLTAGAALIGLEFSWRARDRRLDRAEASAGRLGALLATQPGLTLVMEPSGKVLAAYGAPPPALAIDPLFEEGLVGAVLLQDRPAVLGALTRAASGQENAVVFSPRTAMDRRIRIGLKRLDDRNGPRLIAHAEDFTAQYVRELELDTARAEAEAREAGKTRFLANMSHELRTPLNAVLGFADIMRQRIFGPLPDRYAEYVQNIHQAGGHLLDLINDVLDVSKIEAERYVLSRETMDAREVLSGAMALVRVGADEKGVILSAVLPTEPLDVSADRRALKQIALNLLSNAVKFTPAGGSVTLSAEAIGDTLEIIVADTGVGIAGEDIDRLGRPFEQAGDAEQRARGTGLGLSLVRAFAELHGGTMSLDSTLGEGTAVTVRIPVMRGARAPVVEGGAKIIPLPKAGGQ
ncbi:sensor histidine kinase [Brevundimonas sp. NPDC092305]|uniref:sensor histidine kinase n=1 Tax=Brevundimonas sp. NPDC092305 TaxID=3363957 RepID=UPI0038301996